MYHFADVTGIFVGRRWTSMFRWASASINGGVLWTVFMPFWMYFVQILCRRSLIDIVSQLQPCQIQPHILILIAQRKSVRQNVRIWLFLDPWSQAKTRCNVGLFSQCGITFKQSGIITVLRGWYLWCLITHQINERIDQKLANMTEVSLRTSNISVRALGHRRVN
jgi:hypothetical protein